MYISLLNTLRNAQAAGHKTVRFACSKMDEQVLEILAQKKFIVAFEKKGKNPKKFFDIELFGTQSKHGINGVHLVSTSSRRVYRPYSRLLPVRQGYGVSIISTSQGLMTNTDARTKKIGGQVLFNIW
jgi:small subunit ribosomal protein S8